MPLDCMIEFHLQGSAVNNRLPNVGKMIKGEICLLRLNMILCLFPEHRQIRTIENGWTLTVHEDDWAKVEKAFRREYLGGKVTAQ